MHQLNSSVRFHFAHQPAPTMTTPAQIHLPLMRFMPFMRFLALPAMSALCATALYAQTAPNVAPNTVLNTVLSAEQMIEQLQSPKTRSLTRGFGVVDRSQQAAPPAATPSPAPSLAPSPAAPASAAAPIAPAAQHAPNHEASTPALATPAQSAVPTPAVAAVNAPASPPASLSLHIRFEFDSAKVSPSSQQALKNLGTALTSRSLAESRFRIEGHTDAQGRPDYNQRLSAQRAEAVKDFLAAQGVASTRLLAVGKGSQELANTQDPRSADNRRVKIINLD